MIRLLFTFFTLTMFSQNYENKSERLQRSSVGSTCSPLTTYKTKQKYEIIQALGQASVIGTFYNSKTTAIQGYIQPFDMKFAKEEKEKLVFNVYPNPSKGIFYVSFDGYIGEEKKIGIFDLNGRLMYSEIKNEGDVFAINLESNPSGTYLIRIECSDEVVSKKIIKL